MKLSERKKKILKIVVDDYINTAIPVSSKSVTQAYLTKISSATVRSELSALEELGYLCQPHISSGRIPSPSAYKYYVEELMQKGKLTDREVKYIKDTFNKKADDIEYIIKNVTRVISELTNYTSVALSKVHECEIIENIGLFRYKSGQALLFILTNLRLLRDSIIDIPKDLEPGDIEEISSVLRRLFTNKDLCAVSTEAETLLKDFKDYREIFLRVIDALKAYSDISAGQVLLEGEEKILEQPEYADVENVKNFLSVVTSKEKVTQLLKSGGSDIEIKVNISSDDDKNIPKGCSLVTATYLAGGVKLGKYGVVGPIRMDYKKVISVLENIGKVLENIINNKD